MIQSGDTLNGSTVSYVEMGQEAMNDSGQIVFLAQLNNGTSGIYLATPINSATSTALTTSTDPSALGQPVTLTATVSPATGSGAPTGTVTFMDGSTTLGTVALDDTATGSLTTSDLSVGEHSLTAVYGGDANFSGSTSATVAQSVNQDGSETAVTSSVDPSVYGQPVTFTATLTADAPGVGTPTGTVSFMEGSTTLATESLDSSAAASFSTSALAVGSATVTAVYSGDGDFLTMLPPQP